MLYTCHTSWQTVQHGTRGNVTRFANVAARTVCYLCVNRCGQVRRAVAQLRQAEACRARLEQRLRFEGGPGGEEDASLLHHWVEELDEFSEQETAFMNKMR